MVDISAVSPTSSVLQSLPAPTAALAIAAIRLSTLWRLLTIFKHQVMDMEDAHKLHHVVLPREVTDMFRFRRSVGVVGRVSCSVAPGEIAEVMSGYLAVINATLKYCRNRVIYAPRQLASQALVPALS